MNTILLAEDDELDVISVRRALTKLEFNVELLEAHNGLEAYKIMKDRLEDGLELPQVVLLDLNMPIMNGFELLEKMQMEGWIEQTKVFIMTTSSDVSDRNLVDRYSISGYLIKPLNFNSNTKKEESIQGFFDFHLRNIFMHSKH